MAFEVDDVDEDCLDVADVVPFIDVAAAADIVKGDAIYEVDMWMKQWMEMVEL